MKKFLSIFTIALVCAFSFSALAQTPASNYTEQGGLRTVIGGDLDISSGGEIDVESGATITVNGSLVNGADGDLTAVSTLTTAACGSTKYLNSATEFATTLPAPTAGCEITFIVKAAPASASYTVVTASSANILIGGINELEVDTGDDGPYDADGDTITFVDGVAVVGDFVTLRSDGTSWYLHGQANADGGVTVTKAS